MARKFIEPGNPPKVRAQQSAFLAEQFPSLVAMAKGTGRSIGDIPFALNTGANWWHVPCFNFRSCMFYGEVILLRAVVKLKAQEQQCTRGHLEARGDFARN